MGFRKRKNNSQNRDNFESSYILSDASDWMVREAYKTLRTNIMFAIPREGCRVIGVTSSAPGTGKSINIINIAVSFAEIGKKVLLVDCDMRIPSISEKLLIRPKPGLSEYLSGNCSMDEAVHHISERKIDVLPAGTIPRDATPLLESERMRNFIKEQRDQYDYIFIDLPPANGVADPAIMSVYTDGLIIVEKQGNIDSRDLQSMLVALRMANANLLGIVYNDVHQENNGYYYSHYYQK